MNLIEQKIEEFLTDTHGRVCHGEECFCKGLPKLLTEISLSAKKEVVEELIEGVKKMGGDYDGSILWKLNATLQSLT